MESKIMTSSDEHTNQVMYGHLNLCPFHIHAPHISVILCAR